MEKRFQLQNEGFAKDRVEALHQSVYELKREHPEIISLTLFGSLVRGKSRTESDIDGVMYVDTDYILEHEDAESRKLGDVVDINVERGQISSELSTQRLGINLFLRPDLYDKYNQLIQERVLQKDKSLGPEQVSHLRSLPMSEKNLNYLLRWLINSRKANTDFMKKILEVYTGDLNDKEEMFRAAKNIGGEPREFVSTPVLFLGAMFHLDVGGGIRKYRKLLIDKLLEAGEVGEMIWQDIARYLEHWEQKIPSSDLPTSFYYPRTLKEAKQIYGS
ncbi:MAG: nucleotidyltransferase domain-containing protein [Candidatus Paceibacterota bacterium]|jgi:predicted nucleotidyltransferase